MYSCFPMCDSWVFRCNIFMIVLLTEPTKKAQGNALLWVSPDECLRTFTQHVRDDRSEGSKSSSLSKLIYARWLRATIIVMQEIQSTTGVCTDACICLRITSGFPSFPFMLFTVIHFGGGSVFWCFGGVN